MPYAFWVAKGWKPIETRTHQRFAGLVGLRIAIHAGQHWNPDAINNASQWLTEEQIDETWRLAPNLSGHVLATAFVEKHEPLSSIHERQALIECKTQRWGLFLTHLEELNPPIKATGRQGIWKIEL